jgi:hypothetical protein
LHTAFVATSILSHVAHLRRLFLEGNKIAAFPNPAYQYKPQNMA